MPLYPAYGSGGSSGGGTPEGATTWLDAVDLAALTTYEFEDLPADITEITMAFSDLKMTSTNETWMRLGTASAYKEADYEGYADRGSNTNGHGVAFQLHANQTGSNTRDFQLTLTKTDGNTWVLSGLGGLINAGSDPERIWGHVALDDTLTRILLLAEASNDFQTGVVRLGYR